MRESVEDFRRIYDSVPSKHTGGDGCASAHLPLGAATPTPLRT